MAQHGGIDVAHITVTYLDGRQERYAHVEYLRQSDGLTLVLAPRTLLFLPLGALRSVLYTLAPEEDTL